MNNFGKAFGYAAIALAILLLISFLAGFLAWIMSEAIMGFVFAIIVWFVQKLRKRPTGDWFILYWGIGLTAGLIGLNLVTMFLARFAWIIISALIIGIVIWVWKEMGKSAESE